MNTKHVKLSRHSNKRKLMVTYCCLWIVLSWLTLAAVAIGATKDDQAAKDSQATADVKTNTAANVLKRVRFNALPQDVVQVRLQFAKPLHSEPHSFITRNPSRIVIDLDNNIHNATGKLTHLVGLGLVNNVMTLEADGRFRIVVDLSGLVKYKTRIHGDSLYINIQGEKVASYVLDKKKQDYGADLTGKAVFGIKNIDFRRNDQTGRVIVDLSSPDIAVDVVQEGKQIIANFPKTRLPKRLQRRLDVTDFGTPISTIDLVNKQNSVQMTVNSSGDYEQLAYQVDNQFFIDVKALTESEAEEKRKKEPEYTGKRLSLNFQNVKVRSVLQLIAEFTGINIVVSDTVNGQITLRLTEVPWDQALDIILQTQGLGKQQIGNVMLIAPLPELAKREKQELQALKQVEKLAPLQSELIQLNYAKASEVVELFKAKGNSILSDRGTATFDSRTNKLWVKDTSTQLSEVRDFVKRLDVPVRQVLIEARIVEVDKTYEEDIGVRFGISNPDDNITGTLHGANQLANGDSLRSLEPDDRLNVNLPAKKLLTNTALAAGGPATFGLALAKIGQDIFLDLELSALETEGRAKVISAPRVITADQQEAKIEAGQEIPYQESTSSGATSTSFKKAVLSLEVTPQITPDNRIIMQLKIHKDSRGARDEDVKDEPAINTRSVKTNVLVKNGETVVLGGIYQQDKTLTVKKVPFLGDIPVIGLAFRERQQINNRNELLIFITPKIIMQEKVV